VPLPFKGSPHEPQKKHHASLNRTLAGLAMDAPFVIATRALRMLDPATALSPAGQAECLRMVWEKQAAAVEACDALHPFQRQARANARRLRSGR